MDMSQLGSLFSSAMSKRDEMLASLDKIVVEAESGGGLAQVRMNGHKQVLKLTLAPSALAAAGSDITMLEDLIVAAINAAGRKVGEATEAASHNMLTDLGLPGL
ncbi:hypothetical protein SAMN05421819_2644 [Bryocella elongata]|uniref:Nucleoid-associated protein SAMN05421819_2644 n=1 Tax=Bryocella elongata TaxID=863522 RepID=A0A1H5ZIG9_9BACT|nr:YbaB/EbfC family nucleoid-associated protein [Bryocella elongata]SEG35447.1 hypothetical protein SAMN05421819_2644 [Bryocella elongata]